MIDADHRGSEQPVPPHTLLATIFGAFESSLTETPPISDDTSQQVISPWLYPEELLTLGLLFVTVGVNITLHRTLNTEVLFENVTTYRTLFQGQAEYFLIALAVCAVAFVGGQMLRLLAGRRLVLTMWQQPKTYAMAIRALLVYLLCVIAFGNLQGFIRRLSPIDRDDWLIAIDRIIFFGYEPLKLLEPLVRPEGVQLFMQVYISMMIMPFVTMVVFLHQGKIRVFRDTIISLVLGLIISYPGYLMIPAIGPQYTLRHLFTRPVVDVEAMLEHGLTVLTRDTFPSVHTAVSVICMLLVWRNSTNNLYRTVFALWSLSIVFSTMYLRFHYVCDVIIGVVVSILVTYLGPRLNNWYLGQDTDSAI